MSYLLKLKLKSELVYYGEVFSSFFFKSLKLIIVLIFNAIRFFLFIISSVGLFLSTPFLLFGFYFLIRVSIQCANGMSFSNSEYSGFCVLFFIVPALLTIINTLTKPR